MSEKRPRPGETMAFDFAVFAPTPTKEAPEPKPAPDTATVTAMVTPPDAPMAMAVTVTRAPVSPSPPAPAILTVAQLGRLLTRTLDRSFADAVWVEGEVSGARPAPSGHLYFCLKDEEEDAVVDVVVYRANVTPRSKMLVKDGVRIRLRGKPTFWSPRGKMQLIGDRIEPTGKGALLEALEKLKEKLAAEGPRL